MLTTKLSSLFHTSTPDALGVLFQDLAEETKEQTIIRLNAAQVVQQQRKIVAMAHQREAKMKALMKSQGRVSTTGIKPIKKNNL